MRTDSFSKDKHLPVRRFIADESKMATGLYGPCAIADDLDNIFNMFDPDATFLDGNEQGGISEKNLQNGAVSYDKLAEEVKEKFQEIATEQQLDSLRTELLEKADIKADKATSLSGYGITDAYTKDETDGFFGEVHTAISQKTEETVLYEETVNTPIWTNQPTYAGVLDLDTSDYYYVTLKDTDGTALPAGQFKLMPLYGKYAEAYETVFTLADLKTGNSGTLAENLPVEFTTDYKMRTAGVSTVSIPLNLPMESHLGKLTIFTTGQFIKTLKDGYFTSLFRTGTAVAHYNSGSATTSNSGSDTTIWHFLNNQGDDYKIGKFMDVFTIQMNGDKSFISDRNSFLRYQGYESTACKHIANHSAGFGFILSENTEISHALVYAVKSGYIRNGTVIRVTEVK